MLFRMHNKICDHRIIDNNFILFIFFFLKNIRSHSTEYERLKNKKQCNKNI